MIKLSANVSKKVPIEGLQYSSQQFTAGMEVEVSGASNGEDLKDRLRKLYGLLEESIDEQIRERSERGGSAGNNGSAEERTRSRLADLTRGNGDRPKQEGKDNGNGRHATQAQVKAIYAIAKDRGIEKRDLAGYLEQQFGVDSPKELTISDASRLIDELKSVNSQ